MMKNPNHSTLYCVDFDKGFVEGNVIIISQYTFEIAKMVADPSDKRAKRIWGKTIPKMSPEELRVVKAEMECVAATQQCCDATAFHQHCDTPEHHAAVANIKAAREAAKKANCSQAFWPHKSVAA